MLFEHRHPGKPRRQSPILQLLAHWQSRHDHIKITDRYRSPSSLLYSPRCCYFLEIKKKKNHKVIFFPPYPSTHSSPWENLLASDIIRPRELASGIPVQQLGAFPLHSEAVPFLSISEQDSYHFWLIPLLRMGNCLLQLQPQWVKPGEASEIHLVFATLCRALETWDPSLYPYHPLHHLLWGTQSTTLEPSFPNLFILNTSLVFTNVF